MSSISESKPKLSVEELAALVSTMQTEMLAIKAERDTQIESLQETIVNLAHENELLKRRLLQGLVRIRAIYAADDSFRKLPPEKRKLARDEHVRPLMDAFFEWVSQARLTQPGRNLATKALGYAFNQEHELRRVLADGRLPLDNTRAERSLRKVVVGRKNWMFYGSNSHAESAAAIFSLVASCRLHGVDPEQYFDEVIRALPAWPKDRYLELSPKHWKATRANLLSADLESPLCAFTVPPAALNFAR